MKKLNLVGRQISKLRLERGWTQDRLADELQLQSPYIVPGRPGACQFSARTVQMNRMECPLSFGMNGRLIQGVLTGRCLPTKLFAVIGVNV